MLFRSFFDDSADGLRERFVIAGSLLGAHKSWSQFNGEWKKVLYQHPRVRWFHTKEWRSLTGEFFQFRDEKKWPKPKGREAADSKRESLKSVIDGSNLVAIGVGLLIPDFELVRNAHRVAAELFLADPYEAVLQALIYQAARAAKRVDPKSCIGYVSDDGNKSHIYSELYRDFRRKNSVVGEMMRGLAHLDDKKWPGLQAADIIANITNQVFKEYSQLHPDERVLRTSVPELQGSFYQIACIDKWWLCHALSDLRGIDLFDQLGIDRRSYKSVEEIDIEKERGSSTIKTYRPC